MILNRKRRISSFKNCIKQIVDNLYDGQRQRKMIFVDYKNPIYSLSFDVKRINSNLIEISNVYGQEERYSYHNVTRSSNSCYYNLSNDTLSNNLYLNDKYGDGFDMEFGEFLTYIFVITPTIN